MTFLDYYKSILSKVSFDQALFHKEYKKAISNLDAQEINDLNTWIRTKTFHNILSDQMDSPAMHDVRMQ